MGTMLKIEHYTKSFAFKKAVAPLFFFRPTPQEIQGIRQW